MKFQKENMVVIILLILSIAFSTFIWDKIILPFNDPGIMGIYTQNEFNALNDILRYLLFVFIPLLVLFSYKIFYQKFSIKKITYQFQERATNIKDKNYFNLVFFFIIVFFLLFEFFSLDFPLQKLDLVHEGQKLSSAYRSFLDNSLWSESYVTVGIFYETISSKLIWSIFNHQSVGLIRFLNIFFILILKLLLIILTFKITQLLNINNFYKQLFFIFNSYICINILDYNISSADLLNFREIPIVLTLILIIEFIQNAKIRNYLVIFFGSMSILTVFWSLDRGLVYNLLILNFALYLLLTREYQKLLILIGSIIFFWIFFFFLLENEFQYFVSNSLSILKNMNYIHGIIHPTPFSEDPNSYRASKTLISIIFVLLLSINLFFKVDKKFSINLKIFLFFLAIVSFLSYAYVVGRSDGPHIRNIFGYPLIFFSFYFSYLFLHYLEKKFDLKSFPLSKYFLLLILVTFSFFSFFELDIKKIKSYPERFSKYIYLSDNEFLSKSEIIFLEKSKPLVKKYDCIQLFSNDVALLYLLKKKSCSKYYFVWSVGSKSNQKELITELKNTNFIISKGLSFDWDIPLSQKLFLVNDYIENNYLKEMSIEHWDIYKSK